MLPTTESTVAQIEASSIEPSQIERPNSASSHRSKEDGWRPIDQPNPLYVHALLKKLFKLRYDRSDCLPIKRAYDQMDWRNRGYLLKVDVERYCTQALAGAASVIKNDRLLDIIKSSDSNRDGKSNYQIFRVAITLIHVSSAPRWSSSSRSHVQIHCFSLTKQLSEMGHVAMYYVFGSNTGSPSVDGKRRIHACWVLCSQSASGDNKMRRPLSSPSMMTEQFLLHHPHSEEPSANLYHKVALIGTSSSKSVRKLWTS